MNSHFREGVGFRGFRRRTIGPRHEAPAVNSHAREGVVTLIVFDLMFLQERNQFLFEGPFSMMLSADLLTLKAP